MLPKLPANQGFAAEGASRVRSLIAGILGAAVLLAAGTARAAEDWSYLALGIGQYDVFQNDDTAVDFSVEYRARKFWILRPKLGAEFTTDGAVYGYGGLHFDIPLGTKFLFSFGSAVGYYEEGDGKDLGSEIEFKSVVELLYQFSNGPRVGLQLSHLSNAGIGDKNPGTEVLSLIYAFPLGRGDTGSSARR